MAGTVMHRSKVPLSKWLLAAYFVAVDKRGMSALHLQKQLGIGYEAAWAMLHKLRAAISLGTDSPPFSKPVFVDS